MKPSQGSSQSPRGDRDACPSNNSDGERSAPTDETDFEQSLQAVEIALQELKERYAQVQQDSKRQASLQEQLSQRQQEQKSIPSQRLRTEVRHLKRQLEELEIALESRLLTWKPFWQAIRFGGLGLAIGWVLKSCAG